MTDNMEFQLEKRQIINPEKLRGDAYFATLTEQAAAEGLLSGPQQERLQLDCVALLAQRCEACTRGNSSSLPIETAEGILQSLLFTVGLALKALPTADDAAAALAEQPLQALFEAGRRLTNVKLRAAKHFARVAWEGRLSTPNIAYNDTLDHGIAAFFKGYHADSAAHDIPALIDYPLASPVEGLIGVEFMQSYVESLICENTFCHNFATAGIHRLMTAYDARYADLLTNISAQVLAQALGCVLAGRDPLALQLSQQDTAALCARFAACGGAERKALLQGAAAQALPRLTLWGERGAHYFEGCLAALAAEVSCATEAALLHGVFLQA